MSTKDYQFDYQLLRTWIKQHGLKQAFVARQLGVKHGTVSWWLRGRSTPSAENLVRISELTSIPVQRLLSQRARRRGAVA